MPEDLLSVKDDKEKCASKKFKIRVRVMCPREMEYVTSESRAKILRKNLTLVFEKGSCGGIPSKNFIDNLQLPSGYQKKRSKEQIRRMLWVTVGCNI